MESIVIWTTALIAFVSLAISLTLNILTHLRLSGAPRTTEDLPPISVLKPLKGVDEGLWENMVALAQQRYPSFEILFGAADLDDPALELARDLATAYPDVDIRVIQCPRAIGLNPKVNNLFQLAREARNDVVLVSDSNCRPDQGYLAAVGADYTRDGVGMVAAIVTGIGEKSWGATFENLHLNAFIARAIGASPYFGHPCVLGKSMLFALSDLDAVGGWASVANILAEDYVLGRRFHLSGRRVHTTSHVVPTVNGEWTFERFHARHVRWAQMRRHLSPLHYFFEPVANPTPWFLALAALVRATDFAGDAAPWIAAGCLAEVVFKVALDDILARRLRNKGLGMRGWLAAPAKDLYIQFIWALGIFRRTVEWRGHRFVVKSGSELESVDGRDLAELVEQPNMAGA